MRTKSSRIAVLEQRIAELEAALREVVEAADSGCSEDCGAIARAALGEKE